MSDIHKKCLTLTGSFETSCLPPACFGSVVGNGDKQWLSVGCLQWNIGANTLQPLIHHFIADGYVKIKGILNDPEYHTFSLLASEVKQVAINAALKMQNNGKVLPRWKEIFKELGTMELFQNLQVIYSEEYFKRAMKYAEKFSLTTERGVSLMFDIMVQNGNVGRTAQERDNIYALAMKEADQVERMKVIAIERSNLISQRWRNDVMSRKLCCALGEGTVHGMHYILGEQFNITLNEVEELK